MAADARWLAVASLGVALGCRVEVGAPQDARRAGVDGAAPSGTVMIYSSMYRSVIDAIAPLLSARLPAVKVEWLQSGSEKIATRLDAELAAGGSGADIVMTSDPLWYERLKRDGHFLPYASIRALSIPRVWVDPDGAFVTSRLSTMVLAYNERLVKESSAPDSFEALFSERFRGQVTTPDPLGSGTTFSTLVFLFDQSGPQILERMKAAQTVAAGGSSAAFTRLESGEHRVGFLLLENVLEGRRRGAPIAFKIPKEGAVLIPGPIAILKKAHNPVAARAVYDLLLSPEVQRAIVAGDLHSPFEELDPPRGAPPLRSLEETRFQWSAAFVERAIGRTEEIKRKFVEVMGGR